MPTNEERREVARRLRDADVGRGVFSPWCEMVEAILDGEECGEADGTCDEKKCCERFMDTIAALVEQEPERTCKWVWGEEWLESSPMGPRELQWANWYLNCGCWEGCEDEFEDFYDPYEEPKGHWKYCPNCGARVVKNG